jgi:iron(III) transport system substrate-binding protein
MSGWQRSGAVLGAAALTVALAACGGDDADSTGAPATDTSASPEWAAAIETAKTEGKATLYTTEVPAWIDVQTKGLKDAYGLDLELGVRGGSGVIEERLSAEMRAGTTPPDLFSVIDRDYFTTNKDWFVNLKEAGLPNYDSYPADAKWQDLCVANKISVSGILYNTSLVPADKAPKAWSDLLDPYWKGKIMLVDPRASNTNMGWAVQMQKAYGMQFLEGIRGQAPALTNSTAPAAEQVAAGAYQVTFLSQTDSSSALRAKGAPLKFVIPEGPTLGTPGCVGILKNGAHQAAAKVLLSYLLSPESQSAACAAGLELQSPIAANGCYAVPDGWKPTPVEADGRIEGTGDQALRQNILDALGIK